MKKMSLLFFITVSSLSAQVEIFGLRAYANDDEYRPPIITKQEQITIEFDVTTSQPPNLQIIIKHASKNWKIDENLFVNEPQKTFAQQLSFTNAPNGVNHYTFRYKNSFPNNRNFVEFLYSGNYIFNIVNHNDADRILASGKFILAETSVPVTMTIENKYHHDHPSPMNQMNFISVEVTLPDVYAAADMNSIYHPDVRTVNIIKNWSIDDPYIIDIDDTDVDTFVEDFITSNKKFWIRDVVPGNEYRRLDISSPSQYPNGKRAVLRNNPDVSRFQWQGKPDANGASKLKAFTGANSDYLEVEMRLRLANPPKQKIFLAGGFTEWKALPEYELNVDAETGLYIIRHWLRRGVYDYQYVLGDLDTEGNVIDREWIALEGNDWRTINRFTSLVYYHDRRFGGFDRVIGFVRGRSPGTNEQGKKTIAIYPPPPAAFPRPRTNENDTR